MAKKTKTIDTPQNGDIYLVSCFEFWKVYEYRGNHGWVCIKACGKTEALQHVAFFAFLERSHAQSKPGTGFYRKKRSS